MEQALQGSIGRFTLPEIFQLIANGGKTGTLAIQKDEDVVMIYFKRGKIIYGYGPRQTYHLGQLLKEKGRLTDAQLDEAVRTQERDSSSKRLGQILTERKYISRSDLEDVVRKQVEELIYSLLSWDSGTFKFYENQYPTQEEITVDISVENAILEGYRRIDELNRLKEALPDPGSVLRISETPAERESSISLDSEEWNLLSLISGRRSVQEIVDISNMSRTDSLRKLAALKLAGLVTVSGKKEEETDHLKVMVDRVAGLLEEYLEHKTKSLAGEKTTIHNISGSTKSRLTESELTPNTIEDEN